MEYRTDFTAGVFASIPLDGRFALQPEISLVQKGTTIGHDRRDQRFVKTNYLEVPFLLDYRFAFAGSTASFGHLTVGPTVGFKIGEDAWRVRYVYSTQYVDDIGGEFFKQLDLGLSLGTGVSFQRGRTRLGLGVRFTQGVFDAASRGNYLNAINEREATESAASKHQFIAFTLSAGFEPAPPKVAEEVVRVDREFPALPPRWAEDYQPASDYEKCYAQYVVVYALRTLGRESFRGYLVSPVSEWGGIDADPDECSTPQIFSKTWRSLKDDYQEALYPEGFNRVRTVFYASREEAEAARNHAIEHGIAGLDAYLGECSPLSPPPADQ